MASIFDNVEPGPPIEVFALNKAFLEDTSTDKVNLGVGGSYQFDDNHFVMCFINTQLIALIDKKKHLKPPAIVIP